MRLLTKQSRLDSIAAQFENLEKHGYTKEVYKNLTFWTKPDGQFFTLKVFRGTSSNHIEYRNYRSEERRAQVIAEYKANQDRQEVYKAEQKAKGKQLSGHAQTAQAIREELKKTFPEIKFSVTSESFSMGNSVGVKWTDGPTDNQVEEITNKYQYGHFNGMEDIYEYSNSREDIPQVKYLHTTREMSAETKEVINAKALEIWTGEGWEADRDRQREIYTIWNASPLPSGAKVTGFERVKIGEYEFKYVLTYEGEPTNEAPTFEPVEVKTGQVQIIDYSEKAFAVIGDTKPIKDKLKELGGSFNPRLSCGAGWIFSKKKLEIVTKALTPQPKEEFQAIEAEEVKNCNCFLSLKECVCDKPAHEAIKQLETEYETFNYAG